MNTLKNILAIFSIALLLSACGDDNATSNSDKVFKITGVFGIKLGDKGQGLPSGYINDNKPFDFTPNTAHKNFNSYTISVTPNTHMIYGIKMTSSSDLSKTSCKEQRDEIVKETLATLGDTSALKVSEDGNQWKIREDNQRSIIIDCELALTPKTRQLVMIVSDTSLSKLSYVEWSKHQDDITKPQ
ncbi:MAG TPA: hypothetical protein EYG50_08285 [Cycloclasticus sp.]|jgi:hypothetical protein|nr:hypothetical protein [Cycloclasticus sp.]HIL92720.1 hypothetical protein [Cycloclasticus sp.]